MPLDSLAAGTVATECFILSAEGYVENKGQWSGWINKPIPGRNDVTALLRGINSPFLIGVCG